MGFDTVVAVFVALVALLLLDEVVIALGTDVVISDEGEVKVGEGIEEEEKVLESVKMRARTKELIL